MRDVRQRLTDLQWSPAIRKKVYPLKTRTAVFLLTFYWLNTFAHVILNTQLPQILVLPMQIKNAKSHFENDSHISSPESA